MLHGLNDFTIAFWAKTTGASTDEYNYFSVSGPATTGTEVNIFYDYAPSRRLTFIVKDTEYAVPDPAITDTVWFHIALRRSNGRLTAFLDGMLVADLFPGPSGALDVIANGLIIGQEQDACCGPPVGNWSFDGAQALGGSIDELRVYNRGLSDGDIAGLHQLTP